MKDAHLALQGSCCLSSHFNSLMNDLQFQNQFKNIELYVLEEKVMTYLLGAFNSLISFLHCLIPRIDKLLI
jgi:hypothetical protein